MEVGFDPLSLFTPNEVTAKENGNESNEIAYEYTTSSEEISSTNIHKELMNDDDDDDEPLHVLDLPILQRRPPYEALITILKLFSPEQALNFNPHSQQSDNLSGTTQDVFNQKSIPSETIQSALTWFKSHCPRFDTESKLASIPHLSISFKRDNDYNAYLTRIIANDLYWIHDEDQKQHIYKETSLRLSENCGKSAQPEIIRKISLPNFEKQIFLKEPSMTSDNIGFKTWGASFVLANRLINKQRKDGYLANNVLELGSGTGLVGMVSGLLGYNTWLTDLPEIIPNLQENIDLNEINDNVKVDELDWCDPTSFVIKYGEDFTFKTIVVSDPIYSPQHPYWLVNIIEKFSSSEPNSRVLIQIPLRPKYEAERQLLWTLMDKQFLQLEEDIEDGFDDYGEMKFIFKLYIRK